MTLKEFLIKVTNIDPNQAVLDLSHPILEYEIKISETYELEADFIIAIHTFGKRILLEVD